MPTHSGPNIKGEENLVFGYDLGDIKNSFAGEPVENILALGGSDTEIERSGTSYPYYSININSYIQERWSPTNNVLALSFEGKRDYVAGGTGGGNDGYPVMYVYFSDWSWSASFGTNGYDWNRAQRTATMPDPTGKTVYFAIYHMNSGNRGKSYSRKHMVTFGGTYKQYVNGTRSATQGLRDISKNSTIDLTNVSFDQDAKSPILLDGTDDYIDLGSELTSLDTSVLTIEMVFRTASGTAGMVPLLGWHHGESAHGYICTGNFTGQWGNESLSFYNEGTGTTPLSFAYTNGHGFLNDSQYHHIAFVLQTGAYKIFLEGEEVPIHPTFRNGSMSTVMPSNLFGYGSTPSVAVGVGSSQPTHGHLRVPICKIYNRALTAKEIKANFNAIKGRFGI